MCTNGPDNDSIIISESPFLATCHERRTVIEGNIHACAADLVNDGTEWRKLWVFPGNIFYNVISVNGNTFIVAQPRNLKILESSC